MTSLLSLSPSLYAVDYVDIPSPLLLSFLPQLSLSLRFVLLFPLLSLSPVHRLPFFTLLAIFLSPSLPFDVSNHLALSRTLVSKKHTTTTPVPFFPCTPPPSPLTTTNKQTNK